jgi:hypothetical protein
MVKLFKCHILSKAVHAICCTIFPEAFIFVILMWDCIAQRNLNTRRHLILFDLSDINCPIFILGSNLIYFPFLINHFARRVRSDIKKQLGIRFVNLFSNFFCNLSHGPTPKFIKTNL